MTLTLQTQSISKIYQSDQREIYAVNDVSFTVEAGEFVALVGPSGSGKTSLLAILAGLLRPSQGEIVINGQNLSHMSDAELTNFRLRQIGFTFQANNMLPFLTALENVELLLRLNGRYNKESAQQAKKLLERLGLGERMNNLPSQLSGGQQQRVAIARALIHNPSVVLADEPTASLDTERAYQVVEMFASLIKEQGKAGIMVTHDLRLCQFVDRVLRMQDGKLVQIISGRAAVLAFANADSHHQEPAPAVLQPTP